MISKNLRYEPLSTLEHHALLWNISISSVYRTYLEQQSIFRNEMLVRVRAMIEQIVTAAMDTAACYEHARRQYNEDIHSPRQRVHIVPYIRINRDHGETYLSLTWAKLKNSTYQGNLSHQKAVLHELSKRTNGHFSKNDLKAALNSNNYGALGLLLQTEHVLRYWRNEYRWLSELRRELKCHRQPTKYQKNLAQLQTIYKSPYIVEREAPLLLEQAQRLGIDPFNLPRVDSLFAFTRNDSSLTVDEARANSSYYKELDDELPL